MPHSGLSGKSKMKILQAMKVEDIVLIVTDPGDIYEVSVDLMDDLPVIRKVASGLVIMGKTVEELELLNINQAQLCAQLKRIADALEAMHLFETKGTFS